MPHLIGPRPPALRASHGAPVGLPEVPSVGGARWRGSTVGVTESRRPGGFPAGAGRRGVVAIGQDLAGWREIDRTTWLVLAGYVVLAAAPFVIAATHASFWKPEHSTAPVASLGFAVLLGALVLRRIWAWWLLVIIEAATLISFAFDLSNPPARC